MHRFTPGSRPAGVSVLENGDLKVETASKVATVRIPAATAACSRPSLRNSNIQRDKIWTKSRSATQHGRRSGVTFKPFVSSDKGDRISPIAMTRGDVRICRTRPAIASLYPSSTGNMHGSVALRCSRETTEHQIVFGNVEPAAQRSLASRILPVGEICPVQQRPRVPVSTRSRVYLPFSNRLPSHPTLIYRNYSTSLTTVNPGHDISSTPKSRPDLITRQPTGMPAPYAAASPPLQGG